MAKMTDTRDMKINTGTITMITGYEGMTLFYISRSSYHISRLSSCPVQFLNYCTVILAFQCMVHYHNSFQSRHAELIGHFQEKLSFSSSEVNFCAYILDHYFHFRSRCVSTAILSCCQKRDHLPGENAL